MQRPFCLEKRLVMKFDFCIGNPPYQEDSTGNSVVMPSIFNVFMDAAYTVADKVEMITPAKFLFNAGSTPKAWNEKILNDEHFKVLLYEPDSSKFFSVTDISGGIAIHYHDENRDFGKIGIYTVYPELNSIVKKVSLKMSFGDLSSIVYSGRSDLKFTNEFLHDYPSSVNTRLSIMKAKKADVTKLCPNEEYELRTNTLDVLSDVFLNVEPADLENYYKIYGLSNNKRVYRWISKCYMKPRHIDDNNIKSYKVVIPLANENKFGGILGQPLIFGPFESNTPTFISIGKFDTFIEASACAKYIKTKFVRALLGVLKATQLNSKPTWKYVPLQNFTNNSDIDWSKSVHEIDLQLYRKYGLSDEETRFIEEKVKAMN